MSSLTRSLVSIALIFSLTACLGTTVKAPTSGGKSYGSTDVHLIGSSTAINASSCPNGLKEVTTFVPLWGVAVGILTIGILVPMETVFTCRA
jgi:hypothetical protein